jgi:hypothetical protein
MAVVDVVVHMVVLLRFGIHLVAGDLQLDCQMQLLI